MGHVHFGEQWSEVTAGGREGESLARSGIRSFSLWVTHAAGKTKVAGEQEQGPGCLSQEDQHTQVLGTALEHLTSSSVHICLERF